MMPSYAGMEVKQCGTYVPAMVSGALVQSWPRGTSARLLIGIARTRTAERSTASTSQLLWSRLVGIVLTKMAEA